MEAEKKNGLLEVWAGVRDPRQAGKVEHNLVEMRAVAVAAVLAGADTFVEIEAWAKEKLDELQQYLKLEHGLALHDTYGRLFAAISADEFSAAFRRWVSQVLPALGAEEIWPSMARPVAAQARWAAHPCIWSALLQWSSRSGPARAKRRLSIAFYSGFVRHEECLTMKSGLNQTLSLLVSNNTIKPPGIAYPVDQRA